MLEGVFDDNESSPAPIRRVDDINDESGMMLLFSVFIKLARFSTLLLVSLVVVMMGAGFGAGGICEKGVLN